MNYKIPIYPNVGDNPIPPTPINLPNQDYLVNKFNAFVDYVLSSTNTMSNVVSNIVYYVDNNSGSDLNNGLTSQTAFKTVGKVIDVMNSSNTALGARGRMQIIVSGDITLEKLDELPVVNFVDTKLTIKPLIPLGARILLPNGKLNLSPWVRTVFEQCIIQLSGAVSGTNLDVEFDLDTQLQVSNNNSTLFLRNSSLTLTKVKVFGEYSSSTLVLSNSTCTLKQIEFISNNKSGYFLEAQSQSVVNLAELHLTWGINSRSKLFKGNKFTTFYSNSSDLIDGDGTVMKLDRANDIVSLLSSIEVENDKLPLSAIADSASLAVTPQRVRDSLHILTGDNRLDASAVKNLPNVSRIYSTVLTGITLPPIGNSFDITLGATEWLQSGQYVRIQNAGIYRVNSITSSSTINLRNLGVNFSGAISTGAVVTLSPEPETPISTIIQAFQLPEIGEQVTVKLDNTARFVSGLFVFIESLDYFGCVSVNHSTGDVKLSRLGVYTSTLPNSIIDAPKKIVITGIPGKKGSVKDYFLSNFTIPEPLEVASVEISYPDFSVQGLTVYVVGVGNFDIDGIRTVPQLDGGVKYLMDLRNFYNIPSGYDVPMGTAYIISGIPGRNSYSYAIAPSTIPPIGDTVELILDNVDWIRQGMHVLLKGNSYEVVELDSLGSTVSLKNLEDFTNIGSPISIGELIILAEGGIKSRYYALVTEQTPLLSQSNITVNSTELFVKGSTLEVEDVGIFVVQFILSDTAMAVSTVQLYDNSFTFFPVGKKVKMIPSTPITRVVVEGFTVPPYGSTLEIQPLSPMPDLAYPYYLYNEVVGLYQVETFDTLRHLYLEPNRTLLPYTLIEDDVEFSVMLVRPEVNNFRITSSFTQPNEGQNVNVELTNPDKLTIGQSIYNPSVGIYTVVNSSTLRLDRAYLNPGSTVVLYTNFTKFSSQPLFSRVISSTATSATVDDDGLFTEGNKVLIGGRDYIITNINRSTKTLTLDRVADSAILPGTVVCFPGYDVDRKRTIHDNLALTYTLVI